MSSLTPDQPLLHYRILGKIGEGGMGEVYKAEDSRLGRFVAIKRLPPDTAQDEKARQRLLREARSASALNHSNIVVIYAIESADGSDFIVMEYVEGETLKAMIGRGPLELPQLLDIGAQVAEALAAAHAIGLIHRDLKPANIVVTPQGRAKVLDFGLAKMHRPKAGMCDFDGATVSADLTDSGAIVGTVAYMSPEQTRGEPLDFRTDLFSLGAVLYEAATGRPPFRGPSLLAIMHDIATRHPTPPGALRPDLPREFDVLLEKLLAKDRDRRDCSAAELAAALRRLGGSAPPSLLDIAPPPASGGPAAFVGRDAELKRLGEALQRAGAGSGRIVFLTGEPGIGKTALADEFLRRARRRDASLLAARGRCVEQYGTGEAYLPWLDALGALLDGPHHERILGVLTDPRTYLVPAIVERPSPRAGFTSNCSARPSAPPRSGCSASWARPSGRWPRTRRWSCSWRTCIGPTRRASTCSATWASASSASACWWWGPTAPKMCSSATTRSSRACWSCRPTGSATDWPSGPSARRTWPATSTRASHRMTSRENSRRCCCARPRGIPCSRPASSSSLSSGVISRKKASAGGWRGHWRRSPWRPRRASAA